MEDDIKKSVIFAVRMGLSEGVLGVKGEAVHGINPSELPFTLTRSFVE